MTISVPLIVRAFSVYILITFLSAGSAEAAAMTLSWDRNPASGIGYHVLWGTRPGQYTRVVDVGANTSFQFEGPTPPTIYYFSVRAYDTRGRQSEPSVEVNTGPWPVTGTTVTPLTISASRIAPQQTHTAVRFTANVGCEKDYRYKGWVFDGVSWAVVRECASQRSVQNDRDDDVRQQPPAGAIPADEHRRFARGGVGAYGDAAGRTLQRPGIQLEV